MLSEKGDMLVTNKYVYTTLILLIVLYSSLVAPNLPVDITSMLDNWWVKSILFFTITYLASKDKTVALLVTLAVIITIQAINKNKILGGIFEGLEITPTSQMLSVQNNDVVSKAVPIDKMPTADNLIPDQNKVVANTISPVATTEHIVMDQNNEPVKDDQNNYVVANPTVVQDESGNSVTDASGNPVVVAPKTAITTDGSTAKDKDGNVIVAAPIAVKDASGNVQTDKNGNIIVKHCKVDVRSDGEIYMVNINDKDYYAYERPSAYGKDVMKRNLTDLCENGNCYQGNNNNVELEDTKSNLCDGGNCYDGYNPREYADF